jgi:hypothetical protein
VESWLSSMLTICIADFDESAEDSADDEDEEDDAGQGNLPRGRNADASRQDQEEDESFK